MNGHDKIFKNCTISWCRQSVPECDWAVIGAGARHLGGQVVIPLPPAIASSQHSEDSQTLETTQTTLNQVTHYIVSSDYIQQHSADYDWRPLLSVLKNTNKVCIVSIRWFDDSVRVQRRLPEEFFIVQVPDNAVPVVLPKDTDPLQVPQEPKTQFMKGRSIYFEPGYPKDKKLLALHRKRCLEAGAVIVTDFSLDGPRAVNILITNSQYGQRYKQAFASGQVLIIATWFWLNHVLAQQKLCHSQSDITHYPPPHSPPQWMNGMTIAITNYAGQAREVIKLMIAKMGGIYTSTLTAANDLLICSDSVGQKYRTAKDWGVNTVNHTWVEECWKVWRRIPLTEERYLVMAPGLRLVVGQTEFGRFAVRPLAEIQDEEEVNVYTKVQQEPKVITPGAMSEDENEETEAVNKSRRLTKVMQEDTPVAKPVAENTHSHPRYTHTKRRFIESDSSGDDSDASIRPRTTIASNNKRKKILASSATATPEKHSGAISFMLTGFPISASLQANVRALKSLGCREAKTIETCTHLIARKLARTEKFLCGLAHCDYILNMKWVENCVKENTLLDESAYVLVDKEIEKAIGVKLKTSMQRAKRERILDGWQIVVTPNVKPTLETLKQMVESHGGLFLGTKTTARKLNAVNPSMLMVVSCEDDKSLWNLYLDRGIHIYTSEVLIVGILKQALDFGSEFELAAPDGS